MCRWDSTNWEKGEGNPAGGIRPIAGGATGGAILRAFGKKEKSLTIINGREQKKKKSFGEENFNGVDESTY